MNNSSAMIAFRIKNRIFKHSIISSGQQQWNLFLVMHFLNIMFYFQNIGLV
jgi:hypothetical protein